MTYNSYFIKLCFIAFCCLLSLQSLYSQFNYDENILIEIKNLDSLRNNALSSKQYPEALSFSKELKEKVTKFISSKDTLFYFYQIAHAYTHKATGDFETGEKHYLEIIDSLESLGLTQNSVYVDVLNNISVLYMDWSKYEESKKWFEKTIIKTKEVHSEQSRDFYVLLNNYGLYHYYIGKYDEAIIYYKKSLSIIEKLEGKESSEYGHKLNNLAGAYFRDGDLYRCLDIFTKALQIVEKTDGKLNKRYLLLLGNLSYVHKMMGHRVKAIQFFEEQSNISEQLYGINEEENLEKIFNESDLLYAINDYESAIKLLEKYIVKASSYYGSNNSKLLFAYYNKGKICRQLGETKEGLKAIKKARDIALLNHGKEFDQLGVIKSLHASYLIDEKRYDEAIKLKTEAAEIIKNSVSENHRDYITILHSLGRIEFLKGDLVKARSLINQARLLKKNNYGSNSSILLKDDVTHANLLFYENNIDSSFMSFKELLDSRYNYLYENMAILSFERKLNLYEDYQFALDQFLSRFLIDTKPNQETLKYIIHFNRRVLNLASTMNSKMQINLENANSEEILKDKDELGSLNGKINRYLNFSNSELKKRKINLDSLFERSKKIEDKIALKLEDKEQFVFDRIIETGVAHLDIIDFKYSNLDSNKSKKSFGLFYYDDENIISYELNNLQTLSNFSDSISNDDFQKMSDVILDPIEDSFTQEIHSFKILPSPSTSNLPYYTLKNKGEYVVDKLNLSVTTNQYESEIEVDANNFLLIGNDFKEQVDIALTSSSESLLAMRSKALKSRLSQFQPIYGVKKEVDFIESYLQSKNLDPTKLFNANEEDTKQILKDNNFDIIHIASHGYYLDNDESYNSLKDQLNLSGFACADANNHFLNPEVTLKEDGLISAAEVQDLGSQNASLVILSTCNSAKGVPHNFEGHLGLETSFRSLGVRNIISTLWKVNDQVSFEFMEILYENLFDGQSINLAFNNSISVLKDKYPVSMWGAFALKGNGNDVLFHQPNLSLFKGIVLLSILVLLSIFIYKTKLFL